MKQITNNFNIIIFGTILLSITVSCHSHKITQLENENGQLKAELEEMRRSTKQALESATIARQSVNERRNALVDSVTEIRNAQFVMFYLCLPGFDDGERQLFIELIEQDLAPHGIKVAQDTTDTCRVDIYNGSKIRSIRTPLAAVELRQQIRSYLNVR